MNKSLVRRLLRIGFATLVIAATGSLTRAEPILWPVESGGNGHFYEYLGIDPVTEEPDEYAGLTWPEAMLVAASRSHLGLSGHLVTINSAAEYHFISWRSPVGLWYVGAWTDTNLPSSSLSPTGWRWITGEAFDPSVVMYATGVPEVENMIYMGVGCGAWHGPMCSWRPLGPPGQWNGAGFWVEYDGMPIVDAPPQAPVPEDAASWGAIKAFYR